jgi:acetyl esterase/lipase
MRITLIAVITACALGLVSARSSYAADRYLDEVFPNVTVTSNIAYGQALDEFSQLETLRLDLYQPTGDTLTSRPVVIFVHGGGFTGGSKTSVDAVNYVTLMARRGFVTASISYRLHEGGFTPAEQAQVVLDAKHDAQAAVRWFRANAATYSIDTSRVSIAGYSAGAVTALFVAYTASDPGDSGNPGYPSDVAAVVDISGSMGDVADDLMDAGEPPVLIVHGTNDATVPYSESQAIVAAAEADGIPYELHTLTGVGHSKFGPVYIPDMAEWSGAFLYIHVIAGAPVGGMARLSGVMSDSPSGVTALEALLMLAVMAAMTAARTAMHHVRQASEARQ